MDSLNDMNVEKSLTNASTLLKGYEYANEISNTFTTLTNMSANHGKVMSKSNVLALCHLIELLKAIEMTYHKKKDFLIFAVQYIVQDSLNRLLLIIQAARV
jgi:WASH complex subunit 7